MMKTSYVYVHFKPDLTPFYIGKGGLKRARCLTKGFRSEWHARVVAKYGRKNIIIETLECASEKEAFFREKMTIASLRANGIQLCNKTDGGEGCLGHKHSPETRALLRARHSHTPCSEENKRLTSERHKGKTVSKEARDKISAAMKIRMNNPEVKQHLFSLLRGRKQTPEAVENNRAAQKARVISDEERLRMRTSALGRKQSEETKRKRSESLKGRSRPIDVRAKIAATLSGRKRPPEVIAKMSEAMKRSNKARRDALSKTQPTTP